MVKTIEKFAVTIALPVYNYDNTVSAKDTWIIHKLGG